MFFILHQCKGYKCIIKKGCQLDPCKNGGNCTKIKGTYACVCPAGWEGPTCSNDTNECLDNPCQNNGTCEENGTNSFRCNCKKGWKGLNCSEDVNECLNNPCMNNGKCSNNNGSFHCQCENGWQGEICSNPTRSGQF